MNNLFISYDLKNPGQNYDRVITAIKGLGSWAKVQYSLWFVSSTYTCQAGRRDRAARAGLERHPDRHRRGQQ